MRAGRYYYCRPRYASSFRPFHRWISDAEYPGYNHVNWHFVLAWLFWKEIG